MNNQRTVYNEDLLNSHKKYAILKQVTEAEEVFSIKGWDNPTGIVGPFLYRREIIFYNTIEKLLLIFTHFPIHSLKLNERSDIMIREIKSYVYDNIEFEIPKIFKEIDINDITKFNTLTTRFSTDGKEILKIIRIYDEYRWEFISKNLDKKIFACDDSLDNIEHSWNQED